MINYNVIEYTLIKYTPISYECLLIRNFLKFYSLIKLFVNIFTNELYNIITIHKTITNSYATNITKMGNSNNRGIITNDTSPIAMRTSIRVSRTSYEHWHSHTTRNSSKSPLIHIVNLVIHMPLIHIVNLVIHMPLIHIVNLVIHMPLIHIFTWL